MTMLVDGPLHVAFHIAYIATHSLASANTVHWLESEYVIIVIVWVAAFDNQPQRREDDVSISTMARNAKQAVASISP